MPYSDFLQLYNAMFLISFPYADYSPYFCLFSLYEALCYIFPIMRSLYLASPVWEFCLWVFESHKLNLTHIRCLIELKFDIHNILDKNNETDYKKHTEYIFLSIFIVSSLRQSPPTKIHFFLRLLQSSEQLFN